MTARLVAQQWTTVTGLASGVPDESQIFQHVSAQGDAASMAHNAELIDSVDEVFLGRRSYEAFSTFWPDADVPIAERVNTVDKVVFSRTLESAPWGHHAPARIERDAVDHVRRRRAEGDGTLLLWGSLDLMGELARAGLVDELDLFVAPVALTAGTPLLPAGVELALDLTTVERWHDAVHLRYVVRR